MYEDPWINSLVSTATDPVASAPRVTASSRQSQPEEQLKKQKPQPSRKTTRDPPPASIPKRARSFSDFQDERAAKFERNWEAKLSAAQTGREFAEWFEQIDDEINDSKDEEYELYRDQLVLTQFHLDSLNKSTSSALAHLASLSESFRTVESETSAFQAQCNDLLAEQDRLTGVSENINQNLRFYTELEPLTRRINAAGAGSTLRNEEISEILARLDSCAEYMANHPTQKEAAAYGAKYRQLMTRALAIMRKAG